MIRSFIVIFLIIAGKTDKEVAMLAESAPCSSQQALGPVVE